VRLLYSCLAIWAVVIGGLIGSACASGSKQSPQVVPATPVAVAPTPPAPPVPVDPIEQLIKTSQAHFETGQRELELGHLGRAKQEFDRALEVLLESPGGARTDVRLREHFDRLVDRISAYEISALAEGDGFTETPHEPASIDELLSEATFAPDATEDVRETVRTDLASTPHDFPIPFNERVTAYVALFQGRLRDWITEGLARGSQYLPMIQSVLRAEGLPLDLAYVPLIESAFKPNALSRAKARGVWQFMRGTGIENGLRTDWFVDERSDPEKATLAAAKYLKTLHETFNGDWHLALASYNGGPNRMLRAMKRYKADDFWTLARRPRILPRETREYVPMILAAMIIGRNPQQYGFDITPIDSPAYETVMLPGAVDLRRVAEWTGVSVDVVRALNPELRRWTTPIQDTNYELRVPVGTAAAVTERLALAEPAALASLSWHTVKRGETLLSISRKLRVNRADLAEANSLTVRARVRTGQRLLIPREPTILLAARTDRPAPVAVSRPLDARVMAARTPTVSTSDLAKVIYRVKRGDTLSSIARLFNTSVAALRSWNNLAGSRINAGQRLTIFAKRRS
jgi:membrane-bound lytic murein transglycosylase D